jgi:FKBP-type peptidyl-prolyl cis-trans isomerase FkpA
MLEIEELKMKTKYILHCVLVVAFSCNKMNEKQTASGMKYILHEHKEGGRKPEIRDYVTIKMLYTDDKDSVLFDSRVGGKPLRFQLTKSPFQGSMEEGLMELMAGDSATLFVSADSMFEKVLSKQPDNTITRPKQGSFLKFHIKLMRVQTYNEAELEMALSGQRLVEIEQKALENYLIEKNIIAQQEAEGYYILKQTEGKGAPIAVGSSVQINYTGRLLNGVVVSSNTQSGKPYSFTVGAAQVINGWELAFLKLKGGDKATLIVPSKLAYGAEGIRRENNSSYVVPPYSTLVFDIEVLDSKATAKK